LTFKQKYVTSFVNGPILLFSVKPCRMQTAQPLINDEAFALNFYWLLYFQINPN